MPNDRAELLRRNRLEELYKGRGQTRPQFAVEIGVDPGTVYRWERGISQIPDARKIELASMFDVSVTWLLGWEDDGNDGESRTAA